MNIKKFGLEVVEREKNQCSTSSRLPLPEELPSIHNIMKSLGALWEVARVPSSTLKQEQDRNLTLMRIDSKMIGGDSVFISSMNCF